MKVALVTGAGSGIGRAVARALSETPDGLTAGRAAVGHIVGRDPNSLDRHGVARAAIESCAENFADGVVEGARVCMFFPAGEHQLTGSARAYRK